MNYVEFLACNIVEIAMKKMQMSNEDGRRSEEDEDIVYVFCFVLARI